MGLEAQRPTGVLFAEPTPEGIAHAVREFERNAGRIDSAACYENATRFASQRFREEFSTFVTSKYQAFEAAQA